MSSVPLEAEGGALQGVPSGDRPLGLLVPTLAALRPVRQAPVWLVWSGYAALFSVWVAGPIAGGFAFAAVSSVDPNVEDSGLGFLLYLLPVTNLAGLGWSVVMVVLEFNERSFAVMGARQMVPFGLCMAGCLVPYLFLPVKLFVW